MSIVLASGRAAPRAALAAALAAPLPVLAQVPSDPTEAAEEVVVTASRTALAPSRVGSSLSVIDAATLAVRQQRLVADALRDVPGVAVSRGGGLGAVTQVRIRGAEGNHALVLIDGVEANNPVSNSEFDFANLLAADVERIEILRGPQSALYGSDAVGGVINVITRRHGAGLETRAHAEGGSFGTHEIGASLGGGGERASGGVSVTRFATDGTNIARAGGERDGFEHEAVTLDGRIEAGPRLALAGMLRYSDSMQDFDTQDFAFPPTPTQGLVVDDDVGGHLEQWFFRLSGRSAGALGEHRFGVSETRTDNTFLDAGLVSGGNEGTKTKLDYQYTFSLGAPRVAAAAAVDGLGQWLTVAGERELLDYENRGATPTAPENQRREDAQTSVAAEYRLALPNADFSASARRDDNDLFADATTYRLTGSIALGTRSRLHTSFGTGIANPGFFDLFGFFPGSFVGNPALEPERSTSFDVGVERTLGADGAWTMDATYFRADLEDEIETTFDSSTFLSSVRNLPGTSERRGFELTVRGAPLPTWQLAASYTYTDAEQPDGRAELRRPRHIASLDNTLAFAGGRARVNVGVDYNGEQVDSELVLATPADRVTLGAFTVVTVAADYELSPRWRLYGRVENVLDEEYEEWFSYRGRGRSAVAGFSVALER
ncbi:MAG TPA: TonB-dependent receptor [Gammaproteobacteria bacterium]